MEEAERQSNAEEGTVDQKNEVDRDFRRWRGLERGYCEGLDEVRTDTSDKDGPGYMRE